VYSFAAAPDDGEPESEQAPASAVRVMASNAQPAARRLMVEVLMSDNS
jgi:hypothetical protein